MRYVHAELTTMTLRVTIGALTLHLNPDDAQIFANLLRQPPKCGMLWRDAAEPSQLIELRAAPGGTILQRAQMPASEWIPWLIAVDVAGDITGSLGTLKLAHASD